MSDFQPELGPKSCDPGSLARVPGRNAAAPSGPCPDQWGIDHEPDRRATRDQRQDGRESTAGALRQARGTEPVPRGDGGHANGVARSRSLANSEPLPICELGLSLDVIFHLVEDDAFERYMNDLLGHSSRFVVLYTSDNDVFDPPGTVAPHARHRPIGRWMTSQHNWRLKQRIVEGEEDSTSFADFSIYEKVNRS